MQDTPIDFKAVFQSMPGIGLILMPDPPEFTITDVTNDLLKYANTKKEEIIGKSFFHFFENNAPGFTPSAEDIFRQSLEQVIKSGQPHEIEVQRFDIRNDQGDFRELYWSPLNTPVFDPSGKLQYILHSTKNLTEEILSKREATVTRESFEYYLSHASAPFAILTGREFEFTFVNNAYQELMNGRDLVGKKLHNAIPELKGQPFIAHLQRVFDTGVPFHAAEIAATALFEGNSEATTRYFNLSYTPYKNHQGTTSGILASGYDVTEEVEAKRKSKKQVLNQQAYNLFMQAPVGFSLLMGDEHIIELVNYTALKFTGKTEECIGKPVTEILPEIKIQGYVLFLNRVKETGESIYLKESKVMLTRNDVTEEIYLNIFFQPYYEDRKITGILAIMNDVTEQVLSRKNVEELKERFETMANNIPNLAWIADADGWIFWYNERWYEYTGTTKEQMEGWGWQSVHDPKKLPVVLERWKKSIADGEPFEMVFPLKSAEGTFGQFLTRTVPIRDNEGKVIRWLGTNTDITRQKEMERMKDDFMSMASHELRTPLTTIKAYTQMAEMILEEKNDRETLPLMKRMNSQVNKLTTLIEDLLDVTKMQKGKLVYNEEFFDLSDLVMEVIDYMQKTTATHKIKSNLSEGIKIFGDSNKISQVIDNLISNAIKYSPGADHIVLRTAIQDDGVLLSVKDFGIGILAKDKKKIFTQFYRVSDENEMTFPGMGIGLYICAEIINREGGKIWLESKIGKGSVFNVWLPFDHRKKGD